MVFAIFLENQTQFQTFLQKKIRKISFSITILSQNAQSKSGPFPKTLYHTFKLRLFNSFCHTSTPFGDCPKFKEAADNDLHVSINGFKDTVCIENIVAKGEISHFQQFHLFLQCFPKAFFFIVLTPKSPFTIMVGFVASVDQDQAAQNMRPYL